MTQPAEQEIADLMAELEDMLKAEETSTPAPTTVTAPEEPEIVVEEPPKPEPVAVTEEVPPWAVEAVEETATVQPEPEQESASPRATPRPPPVFPKPSASPSPLPSSAMKFAVDPDQVRQDMSVSETTLDEAMMKQAGLRASYGAIAAHAEGYAKQMKAKFDIIEASLYNKHKLALAAAGEKVTDKAIEAAVKTDPMWLKAKTAVIEAEAVSDANRALTFAMADRKDMLIQLGSDRRAEMQGQLRIVEANARDTVRATLANNVGQRYIDRQTA